MKRYIRCPKGHYREEGVETCPECGIGDGGPLHCPQCGAAVDRGARFCSNCRNPLTHESRLPGGGVEAPDVATKMTILDPLRGMPGGILIHQGEEAVVITEGAHPVVVGPGKYTSGWLSERLSVPGRPVTLAIVRKGLIPLTFEMDGIVTADPVTIGVTATLLVRIDDSTRFIENVAKGDGACTAADLHSFLGGAVANAFSDLVGRKSVKELERGGTGTEAKKALEVMVEHSLTPALQEAGLYLNDLVSVEYDLKGFYNVVDAREQHFIRSEKEEAEVEVLEKRIAVRRKTIDLLGDLSCTDEQIEEYVLEEEKARLLRSQELDDIRTAFEDRKADHRIKRDWIIRKLELDQQLDYERRKLLGTVGMDREVAEARYAVLDVETRLARARLENELADEKIRNLARIEMNELKEESSLRVMAGLVDLKKKKDRDAVENELYKEKELYEMRLREKERELEVRRSMGFPPEVSVSSGGTVSVVLRCVNPQCNASFSVTAGEDPSAYRCPRCSGPVVKGK